jgi:hypothetical protein
MTTLKHKRTPKHNRKPKPMSKDVLFTNWVREYLYACFEHREVQVLPKHQRELENFLF